MNKASLGSWGEAYAARYLTEKGYQIIGQNYRSSYGEIDLIALDGEELVFVEVKTRSTSTFGWPEESVTAGKRERLTNAALAYLQENPAYDESWRIDVVAIRKAGPEGQPEVAHFEHALG